MRHDTHGNILSLLNHNSHTVLTSDFQNCFSPLVASPATQYVFEKFIRPFTSVKEN